MNTHDIELPPLPQGEYRLSPDSRAPTLYDEEMMEAYARAAIEPYAKRIAQLEAARFAYASEFPPDENGDPDVGSIHENIRKLKAELEADLQRRGEPVATVRHFHYEGIARNGPSQEAVMIDGAPMLPEGTQLYAAPQPAEPVSVPKHLIERLRKHCENKDNTAFARSTMREALQYLTAESDRGEPVGYASKQALEYNLKHEAPADIFPSRERLVEHFPDAIPTPLFAAPQPAEPVKVPSDAELFALHDEYFPTMVLGHDNYLSFARALLARYGKGTP